MKRRCLNRLAEHVDEMKGWSLAEACRSILQHCEGDQVLPRTFYVYLPLKYPTLSRGRVVHRTAITQTQLRQYIEQAEAVASEHQIPVVCLHMETFGDELRGVANGEDVILSCVLVCSFHPVLSKT